MPFSFFLFVFYTFKKTACDESAERSQGDEPTRREKNKSLPNWISSFSKVCIFSYLLCGESPDLLALNAEPYLPSLYLLINRNIFLSGLNFGSRSIENSGNVIYSTTEMRVLFVFPRLVVTVKESEPQMKVQMPSCLTKGIVLSSGASLYTGVALFFFSFFWETSASARATPLHWRSITPPRFFLSRALDGLWRENRGSVNRTWRFGTPARWGNPSVYYI